MELGASGWLAQVPTTTGKNLRQNRDEPFGARFLQVWCEGLGGKCAQASEGFLDASLQPPKDKTQLEGNPLFFTEYTRKKSQVAIYILSGQICAKQPSQSCFQDEGIEIHCIKKKMFLLSHLLLTYVRRNLELSERRAVVERNWCLINTFESGVGSYPSPLGSHRLKAGFLSPDLYPEWLLSSVFWGWNLFLYIHHGGREDVFSIELGVQYLEQSSESAGQSVPWYFCLVGSQGIPPCLVSMYLCMGLVMYNSLWPHEL